MRIWWTKPTESGLCDRLLDLVYVLAYARVRGCGLNFVWPQFRLKSIDCPHRAIDIRLRNVLQYIRFPDDVAFVGRGDEKFDFYVGGEGDATGFHGRHLRGVCTLEEYKAALRDAAADFGFCDEINEHLRTLPQRFAAFHIRRGDKVRDEPSDGNFIHCDELAMLNAKTYAALDLYLPHFDTFFFCGDEDSKIGEFADYAKSHGKQTLRIPLMDKWKATYYDIAVMSRAKAVVTSQRYSAFSRFAALLSGASWRTVFMLESDEDRKNCLLDIRDVQHLLEPTGSGVADEAQH